MKGLCWEGRKHRPDEAVLSSKCDQATGSLKMGLLLEPRASLVAQMVKNLPAMQETRFDPWVGKMPWKREWLPTPVFLPGRPQGQRSLMGLSPWGHKESDMTVVMQHASVQLLLLSILSFLSLFIFFFFFPLFTF